MLNNHCYANISKKSVTKLALQSRAEMQTISSSTKVSFHSLTKASHLSSQDYVIVLQLKRHAARGIITANIALLRYLICYYCGLAITVHACMIWFPNSFTIEWLVSVQLHQGEFLLMCSKRVHLVYSQGSSLISCISTSSRFLQSTSSDFSCHCMFQTRFHYSNLIS